MDIYIYIHIAIAHVILYVYACGPKTVPVKRTFLNIAIVGWGGGGHVNVPCTSYVKYCHAAEISGIVYYVTCCYAADGVGWAGLGWGGVGVGGHVNVPCTAYMKYCYSAEISGIVYYVTCCYAAEISGIVYYVTCCYVIVYSGIVYCDDAKKPKNAPQLFPGFPIIKSARHCGKITIV